MHTAMEALRTMLEMFDVQLVIDKLFDGFVLLWQLDDF